jgi:regulator of cell morphogenesis and NO signaling
MTNVSTNGPTNGTQQIPRIDPSMTVNAVLRRHPSSAAVFNAHGIDACCGGARTIRDAALEDGADCGALVGALESALHDHQRAGR